MKLVESGGEKIFDILIRNGQIVDGTENPWFKGAVAIEGDCVKITTATHR